MKADMPTGDFEYFEIMSESNEAKRRQKLEKLKQEFPDNFNILFEWLTHREEMFEIGYLETMQHFEKVIYADWRQIGFADAESEEGAVFLKACHFVLNYYLLLGFYRKALALADFVEDKVGKNFLFGFEHLRYSTYTTLYRLEDLQQHLAKAEFPDDSLLLHLTISFLLDGNVPAARETFEQLVACNSEAPAFFASETWMEDIAEAPQTLLRPYSRDTLSISLAGLVSFLMPHYFVIAQLTQFSQPYLKKQRKISVVDHNRKENLDILQLLDDAFILPSEPHFSGIRHDLVGILIHEGYRTLEDFKKVTEQDILKIRGIGVGTLKKLMANGVVFKPAKKRRGSR